MPQPHSLEAKLQKNRQFTERLADDINRIAGSFPFFILHAAFFAFWVTFMGQLDPFPFTFLTMLVSLEAIFLSVFVLMSQNRQSTIDSLREEIHLQINEIAEREITKALALLRDIHRHTVKDPQPDPELDHMLHHIDTRSIEAKIEKELEPPPLVISDLLLRLEKSLGLKK